LHKTTQNAQNGQNGQNAQTAKVGTVEFYCLPAKDNVILGTTRFEDRPGRSLADQLSVGLDEATLDDLVELIKCRLRRPEENDQYMPEITPFLMFNDQALEAMEFYTTVFPNSKIVSEIHGPDGTPAGGTFDLDGKLFSCYNAGAHPNFVFSQGISLMIYTETQDETDHYYNKLSVGGERLPCGWVTDKFGLSWQVTPRILMQLISDPDREKGRRVTEAMLKMTKIIIADLEAAAA